MGEVVMKRRVEVRQTRALDLTVHRRQLRRSPTERGEKVNGKSVCTDRWGCGDEIQES